MKIQVPGSLPRVSASVDLKRGMRISISIKCSGHADANAGGPEANL